MPLTHAALGRQRQVHPCSLLSIQPAVLESSRPSRRHFLKRVTTGLHMHEHIFLYLHMSAYIWTHAHIYTHTLQNQFTFWSHWVPTWWSQKQWLDISISLTSVPSGFGLGLGLGARRSYEGLVEYVVLQIHNGGCCHGHILNLPLSTLIFTSTFHLLVRCPQLSKLQI